MYTSCMHIYFSGIGGVGLGPLAEIALDAGHAISGSDLQASPMTEQLAGRGVSVHIGQDGTAIASEHETRPIDWFVYTAALPEDHVELVYAREHGIRTSKRDELLAQIIAEKNLKLIAVAGTHGKTTTTGMLVWAFRELGLPLSYSVGASLSFAPSGQYDTASEFFVYECDEYDRNMLHFEPFVSVITSLDYDHPDTYPTPTEYHNAFVAFMEQSEYSFLWEKDLHALETPDIAASYEAYDEHMELGIFTLAGEHVRQNAFLVERALHRLFPDIEKERLLAALNSFPGTGRRFEKLADNLYSDYGHHPAEIAATLQMARELSDYVVLVYQPHQNIRQHELKNQYSDCMELAEEIYWLPTYLSREDPNLPVLTSEELSANVTNSSSVCIADMNENLWGTITYYRDKGYLVVVMGAGSIDEWVRTQLAIKQAAGVLLVNPEGSFIMQHRDDKPTITNPGKVTVFGGSVEPGESARDAALRELIEETNLRPQSEDLIYLATLFQEKAIDGLSRWCTYYVLNNISTDGFEIYEGQEYLVVTPEERESFPLSHNAKRLIDIYLEQASTK